MVSPKKPLDLIQLNACEANIIIFAAFIRSVKKKIFFLYTSWRYNMKLDMYLPESKGRWWWLKYSTPPFINIFKEDKFVKAFFEGSDVIYINP